MENYHVMHAEQIKTLFKQDEALEEKGKRGG